MDDDWDFSGLVKEASIDIMGLPNFFSHLYRSYTLLLGIWYEDSATSWDRDGLVEGSIGAADFRGRLGLDSIRPAQSPR